MKIGCCIGNQAQLAVLEAVPADYCELPVASAVMADGQAFEDLARRLEASPLPAPACNVFLPGELELVGPSVDEGRLGDCVAAAVGRLARLGVEMVVVGSGRSRTVPDDFSPDPALDQFEAFLRAAAEAAAAHGIALALEPLHRTETNLLNGVGADAAFIRERRLDPVRLLADLYHMREEGEALDVIDGCADPLVHAHVAGAGRRALPPTTSLCSSAGWPRPATGGAARSSASGRTSPPRRPGAGPPEPGRRFAARVRTRGQSA